MYSRWHFAFNVEQINHRPLLNLFREMFMCFEGMFLVLFHVFNEQIHITFLGTGLNICRWPIAFNVEHNSPLSRLNLFLEMFMCFKSMFLTSIYTEHTWELVLTYLGDPLHSMLCITIHFHGWTCFLKCVCTLKACMFWRHICLSY